MQVETISVTREAALAKLAEWHSVSRTNATREQQLLAKLYRELAKGKRVLDLFALYQQPGAFLEDGRPAVAVGRITWGRVKVEFQTWGEPSMTFSKSTGTWRDNSNPRFNIRVPGSFLPPLAEGQQRPTGSVQTLVPAVPIEKQPPNPDTEDYPYYVLFEVDKWEPRAPKDPYLLRRVTQNLFVIEAKWATRKLERAFINGKLAAR